MTNDAAKRLTNDAAKRLTNDAAPAADPAKRPSTIAITTLGCKTNQFESAAMEERLRGAGYRVIPFEQGPELVVVNTCTVTAATDAQSRNLIRRARRMNPGCRVVVTGCYAQIDPSAIQAIPGVSLVLGNEEKKDLLALLEDEGAGEVRVSDIRGRTGAGDLSLTSFAERSRAFLQIQNGCDAFCSYCIIPYARGPSRSVPPAKVLYEIDRLTDAGFPEIVLTGIHIGGYGADLQPLCSLTELVGRIARETAVPRLRLGSLEPLEIPSSLLDEAARAEIFCPHFHIPLQAGDDGVLKRMNRHYDVAFFRDLVTKIRSRFPEAAIGLDVITGFPGETEAEFDNTLRLIADLPVTYLHVFPFSKRPGTPAATLPDQVPAQVARERAARLRKLGEDKNRDFARQFLGRILDVVVEGGRSEGLFRGITRNYLAVRFTGGEDLEGKVSQVRIREWTEAGLTGIAL
jgi:threonylcarbamoyladenosine tRNA methylthiotransferase MtaB